MGHDIFSEEIKQLAELYGAVQTANNGSSKYVRILRVTLPNGCVPMQTNVLLELTSETNRPVIYVQPGIQLPNGQEPSSTNVVEKEGESWLQYSYQFQWMPKKHSLIQFVEAALRRFAEER